MHAMNNTDLCAHFEGVPSVKSLLDYVGADVARSPDDQDHAQKATRPRKYAHFFDISMNDS